MSGEWWDAGTTDAGQLNWSTPQATTSAETWYIDNVSLHQYGWSVATLGGARYDLPPRRGSNIALAYRSGQLHRNKYADSRTITLIMWVVGMDPATGNDLYRDQALQWNDSWDFLRRLVWRPLGAEVTLTRKWRLTQNGTATTVSAAARAEIADSMAPTMTGRTRADFTMNLLLADPYFYGAQVVTDPIAVATPTTITNLGHDTAVNNVEIDLVGPLTNPRLTNVTPGKAVWVQYTGSIASGVTIRLKVGDYLAYQVSNGHNYIGQVSHSGARHWMGLEPLDNVLTLTASSGSGHAVVRHSPPYV